MFARACVDGVLALVCGPLTVQLAVYWDLERPIAAIQRGILHLARTRSAESGRSILYGKAVAVYPRYLEVYDAAVRRFGCCRRSSSHTDDAPSRGVYASRTPLPVAVEVEDAVGEVGGILAGPMIWGERWVPGAPCPADANAVRRSVLTPPCACVVAGVFRGTTPTRGWCLTAAS